MPVAETERLILREFTPGDGPFILELLNELRSAWRHFARRNHPDRCPGDGTAPARFDLGRKAYEALRGDPETLQLIGQHQSVDTVAGFADTIGYEILTSLGGRYKRVYIK